MHFQQEEAALRAMEEQREKEEKQRKQAEIKSDLDYSLKLKMKKKVCITVQLLTYKMCTTLEPTLVFHHSKKVRLQE